MYNITRWKVLWESSTPRESCCGLPPPWGWVVNRTAVAAVLIDQSRFYGSRDRRTASEAEKLFRLPSTFLGLPTIRLLLKTGGCLHFMEFFDRYFHIPLPIVTKHEPGLPFPPRNLPIKFGTNTSTIFLVIVVTDRHTDRRTIQRR